MTNSTLNRIFVSEIFDQLPDGAAPVVCGFKGNPTNPSKYAWSVKPALPNTSPPVFRQDNLNAYIGVSSFYRADDGRYRRRKSCFAALHYIMLDDLGTGLGAKVPMERLAAPPTALIETSPDNYQAVLKLAVPITDFSLADKLIRAMIKQGLLSDTDPGMAGVTRVGRLPVGINGKPKYGGWNVRMEVWEPSRSFTVDDIVSAFGLDLSKIVDHVSRSLVHAGIRSRFLPHINIEDDPIYAALMRRGMFSQDVGYSDKGSDGIWVDMVCPWIDEHTDRADTGTAYRVGGGFACHHGHCHGKGIRAVLEKLDMQNMLPVLDQMRVEMTNEAIRAASPYLTQGDMR